jgi:protein involved in polysaccharide export with SLBB domain
MGHASRGRIKIKAADRLAIVSCGGESKQITEFFWWTQGRAERECCGAADRARMRPIAAFSGPVEEGRQEALLCHRNAKKILVPSFPLFRSPECEPWGFRDRLTSGAAHPTGQENQMDVLRSYIQLKNWTGPKQIGQLLRNGLPLRRLAVRGPLVLILVSVGQTACESPRSYERASDGSTVYLDELSEATKADARQKIVASLTRGMEAYELGVGDEIEIYFHIERKPTAAEYVISVADKLRVEFLAETESVRTVQVRPDGRISMPLIGPVMAAGKTVDALAHQLQERYSGILTRPQISVDVTEAHSPLADFIEVLGSSTKGRSIVDKVLPDGTISVPLLPPIRAIGRTLKDLQKEIDAGYSSLGLDVFVSLVPGTLRAGAALVFGEVGKPGRIELERPQTVLMVVAQAGGVLPTGSIDSVRLFYVGDDGRPRVRLINLKEIMEDFKFEQDMIVPNNSVIYVPPTQMAKLGRLEDALLRDILRYNGVSVGGAIILNNPNSNSTVVPSPTR